MVGWLQSTWQEGLLQNFACQGSAAAGLHIVRNIGRSKLRAAGASDRAQAQWPTYKEAQLQQRQAAPVQDIGSQVWLSGNGGQGQIYRL